MKVKNVEESAHDEIHFNCDNNEMEDYPIYEVINGFLLCRITKCSDHASQCLCPLVTNEEGIVSKDKNTILGDQYNFMRSIVQYLKLINKGEINVNFQLR